MAPHYDFDITPAKEASTIQYYWRQFLVTAPRVTVEEADLTGKTAIVTGSNIGLGLEVARQFLELNLSKVILAVRTLSKGEEAKTQLLKGTEYNPSSIEVWNLDLSSYDSIVAFAKRAEALEQLDILVNNAGLFKIEETFNEATGYDEDVQINYISTSLLTLLMLPIIKVKHSPSSPGRICNVSSDTSAWAKFEERKEKPILSSFKRPNPNWAMQERYGTSKLMGQFFVSELSDRTEPSQVIVTLANPGYCYGSGLARDGKGSLLGAFANLHARLNGHTVDVGARSIVAGAAKFGEEAHGQYVEDGVIRPQAEMLYTSEGGALQKQLWEELLDELSLHVPNVHTLVADFESK